MLIFTIKESGSSGDEATAMIIAEHREDSGYVYHKAAAISTSTQTDRKTKADISTQTGDYDDETTTDGPVEEVVGMETAATEEDSLNESVVVIAEEVVEETADDEAFDSQTAGIIVEEVVITENNVYENIVFRADRVEITDNFEIKHIKNSEEESVDETEPENAESNPNESIVEGEIVAEENNVEESVPLEIYSSLPKVVADCVEVVFAAVSEFPYFAAVKPSEPSVEEVITEDNDEGAGDMSADEVLIEIAEPESNAVTPEIGEANSVPSLDDEPVMEKISEDVCEDSDPTPANQDMPVEELSLSLVPEILVKVESAHEEVTTDDAPTVEDVPGKSEDLIIVGGPSDELISIEELPEDTLNSLDDEAQPESIAEVITTDENTEVSEDAIADVGPETVEEAEPSPVNVKDNAVETPEAAIEALSQELSAIAPPEPEVDSDIPLEEEVIVATTFEPLSAEREANLTIPEEPSETVSEEVNEEAIVTLSNELEAIPADERADVPQTDSTGESEPCVSVQEELVEESITSADVLLEDADKETAVPFVAAVEEPTGSNPVTSEELEEESAILSEPHVLVVIFEANDDEATEEIMRETEDSGDVLPADDNSEDSQVAPSDEPVAKYVEVVLETITEEIITEDECNLVTSEEEAPEIIAEGETEEKSENELSENSTDSIQSAEMIEDTPATSTDMDALLVRLQSACTSVFEESTYRLVGLKLSSVGYSIIVTIHVASEDEQQ